MICVRAQTGTVTWRGNTERERLEMSQKVESGVEKGGCSYVEPAAAATCGVVGTSLQGMWTWPAAVLALALTAAPTVFVAVSLALGLVLCLSAFAIATAAHACASGATHGVTFKIPFSAFN